MEEDWGWNADDGNGGGECREGGRNKVGVFHMAFGYGILWGMCLLGGMEMGLLSCGF